MQMIRFANALCLLAVTTSLIAASDQIDSKRAPQDASADTNPNSDFWRGVPAIFAERDTAGNPVAAHRTEIRSRWTATNLYFLFICPYEQLNLKPDPKTEIETNLLWKWDVAEAFIGSDFQHIRKYKEFEISPQSEWVDLDIDLDAPLPEGGWKWNSGFQTSARIDKSSNTWYAFMRIPYASVDPRPAAAGNTLRINLFRAQGTPPNRKLIAWQTPHRPSFHVPEVFGTLKLTD